MPVLQRARAWFVQTRVLESPEISSVPCLIMRRASGLVVSTHTIMKLAELREKIRSDSVTAAFRLDPAAPPPSPSPEAPRLDPLDEPFM